MCLAVPAKVVSVTGDRAEVVSLIGTRQVDVRLVHVRPGDFVLVQGGFAVERLDPKDAEEILGAWEAAEADPHA